MLFFLKYKLMNNSWRFVYTFYAMNILKATITAHDFNATMIPSIIRVSLRNGWKRFI